MKENPPEIDYGVLLWYCLYFGSAVMFAAALSKGALLKALIYAIFAFFIIKKEKKNGNR